MTPEDRARLERIEHELAAHDRAGSVCLHMQACCSIGAGEHIEWLIAALRRADTDARLAASESSYLLQRAEKAESKLTEVFERTDAALANECKLHYAALDRAEQAEMERNQAEGRTRSLIDKLRETTELGERLLSERNAARESGAEYIKRTDPLLACDSEDFTCGECRACAIQQRNEARGEIAKLCIANADVAKLNADLQIENMEAREQLEAAVCVLRDIMATGSVDGSPAAFSKIAHLLEGK